MVWPVEHRLGEKFELFFLFFYGLYWSQTTGMKKKYKIESILIALISFWSYKKYKLSHWWCSGEVPSVIWTLESWIPLMSTEGRWGIQQCYLLQMWFWSNKFLDLDLWSTFVINLLSCFSLHLSMKYIRVTFSEVHRNTAQSNLTSEHKLPRF